VATYESDHWAALGDPTRREIFERLLVRPQAVGELSAELPVSRPAVSQHLKVLKRAGLVADQPEGARRIYSVQPAGLALLRADLERFWSSALSNYEQLVEESTKEER
jgi:DNA-binding transcriptional ArsR family regulator